MNFLGYGLTLRRLETVAERFGGFAPRTNTNLRQVTLEDAREKALAAEATAVEAEEAWDGARKEMEARRSENDAERQRLAMVARQEREAADEAPSRKLIRLHDANAEAADRDIVALDGADQTAEAGLEPLEFRAGARRVDAHKERARALRVLRDAAFADADLEVGAAEREADAIAKKLERRGVSYRHIL